MLFTLALVSALALADTSLIKNEKLTPLPESNFQQNFLANDLVNGELLGKTSIREYVPMHTSKVFISEFTPKKAVEAAYEQLVGQKMVSANVAFTANRPIVNLDNFEDIVSIECQEDLISLTFASAEAKKAALESWTNESEMAIMIGHERQCKGISSIITLAVEKVIDGNNEVLTIDTKSLNSEDLFEEIEINLAQSVVPLEKRQSLGKNISYDFDINYDRKSQTVTKPSISLHESKFGRASCLNCYSAGEITLGVNIKMKLAKIVSYAFYLDGDFKANLDLDVTAFSQNELYLFRTTLFTKSLGAVQVPGLFKLGPQLLLEAGVVLNSTESINASYGFDVKLPFDITLKSDKGLFDKPVIEKSISPSVTEHQFKATKDIEVKTSAHLIPALEVGVEVLTTRRGLRLELDSSIGVAVRTGGFRESKCPQRALEISLYHEHEVNFEFNGAKRNEFTLYDTGELTIKCFFCGVCIKPGDGNSGSNSTTTVIPTSTSTAVSTTTTTSITTIPSSTTTAASTTTITATNATTTTIAATTATPTTTNILTATPTTTTTTTVSSVGDSSTVLVTLVSTSTISPTTVAATNSVTTTTEECEEETSTTVPSTTTVEPSTTSTITSPTTTTVSSSSATSIATSSTTTVATGTTTSEVLTSSTFSSSVTAATSATTSVASTLTSSSTTTSANVTPTTSSTSLTSPASSTTTSVAPSSTTTSVVSTATTTGATGTTSSPVSSSSTTCTELSTIATEISTTIETSSASTTSAEETYAGQVTSTDAVTSTVEVTYSPDATSTPDIPETGPVIVSGAQTAFSLGSMLVAALLAV